MDKSKMPTDLNVPKRLISACKNDKVRCELLALSVRIKIEFGDSLMKNVSPYSIQKILHCGYNKAKSLLLLAKSECDLFYYNPYTNSLLAKNFKKVNNFVFIYFPLLTLSSLGFSAFSRITQICLTFTTPSTIPTLHIV